MPLVQPGGTAREVRPESTRFRRVFDGREIAVPCIVDNNIQLVKRAIESGDIRPDLDAFDLLRALIGVSNVASTPDWPQSARRLVGILIAIAGSRLV